MRLRRPAVAGLFYPSSPEALKKKIEDSFLHPIGPGRLPPKEADENLIATVNPHAGYDYSGPVAAHSFLEISARQSMEIITIIGPNHYGFGSGVAAPLSDEWETPLGTLKVDVNLARKLMISSRLVDMDDAAHWREHSIEVQLPFLQYSLEMKPVILPISMAMQDMNTAVEVGDVLANLLKGRRALLIASSDFSHYEPYETAKEKDMKAIEAILTMDVSELYRVVEKYDISMCGFGPVAVVLVAAKRLGAKEARLLKYATSGDVTGDYSSVVGYGSIAFYR